MTLNNTPVDQESTTENKDRPREYISFYLRQKERIAKYEELMNFLTNGGQKKSEILRNLIDLGYGVHIEGREFINLENPLDNQIKSILANEHLKKRYYVSNLKDVINRAVEDWLSTKKSEINLHNWDFRKNLPDDEKSVANTFVQYQMEPAHYNGLTLDELAKYIDNMDIRKIKQIVKGFVNGLLLESDTIDDNEYFYAPLP